MIFRTIVSDYLTQAAAIRSVRDQVFIQEQGISPELEHDQHDNSCLHAVVYENDLPIATGRLDVLQQGKIGRVAVLKAYRRRGVGTLAMQALEARARAENLNELWFHAQVTSVPFYQALGYHDCGTEFLEANIPHLKMKKNILENC